jgi:hypothetical protein
LSDIPPSVGQRLKCGSKFVTDRGLPADEIKQWNDEMARHARSAPPRITDYKEVVAHEFAKAGVSQARTVLEMLDRAALDYRIAKRQKFSFEEHRERLKALSNAAKRMREMLEYKDDVLELLLEPELEEASPQVDFDQIEPGSEREAEIYDELWEQVDEK